MAAPRRPAVVDPYRDALLAVLGDLTHPKYQRRKRVAAERLENLVLNGRDVQRPAGFFDLGYQVVTDWISGQHDPLSLEAHWKGVLQLLVAKRVSPETERAIDQYIAAILSLQDQIWSILSAGTTDVPSIPYVAAGSAGFPPIPPLPSGSTGFPPIPPPAAGITLTASQLLAPLAGSARDPVFAAPGPTDGTADRVSDSPRLPEARRLERTSSSAGDRSIGPQRPRVAAASAEQLSSRWNKEVPRRRRSPSTSKPRYVDEIAGKTIIRRAPREPGSAQVSASRGQELQARMAARAREIGTDTTEPDGALGRHGSAGSAIAWHQDQEKGQQAAPLRQPDLPVRHPPILAVGPVGSSPRLRDSNAAQSLPDSGALFRSGLPIPTQSSTAPLDQGMEARAGSGIPRPESTLERDVQLQSVPELPPSASAAARSLIPSPPRVSPFAQFSGLDGHSQLKAQSEARTLTQTQLRCKAGAVAPPTQRIPPNPAMSTPPLLRAQRPNDPDSRSGASTWNRYEPKGLPELPEPRAPNFVLLDRLSGSPNSDPPSTFPKEWVPSRLVTSGQPSPHIEIAPPRNLPPVILPPAITRSPKAPTTQPTQPTRPTSRPPQPLPLPTAAANSPVARPPTRKTPSFSTTTSSAYTITTPSRSRSHTPSVTDLRLDPATDARPVPRQRSRKSKNIARALPPDEPGMPKDTWGKKARRGGGQLYGGGGWAGTVNMATAVSGATLDEVEEDEGQGQGRGQEKVVLGTSTMGRKIKASAKLVGKP